MVLQSTRFRNRKINFKTRIAIHTGSLDVPDFAEDELDDATQANGADGTSQKNKGRLGVETGVDKDEESEHHLQVAIAASAASLTRRSGRVSSQPAAASSSSKVPSAYIPTPDATGLVNTYDSLYSSSAWSDPLTYIRFSDTVEDTQGVEYTMDEVDEAFLTSLAPEIVDPWSANGDRERRSPRKGKETEGSIVRLGEDEFERIMDAFERVTEEKSPLLHLVSLTTDGSFHS
jgi:enhancer of polycomb-like protein